MAFEGMDVDAVTGMAGQLDSQASQIQSVISSIDGIISNMEGSWKGADALEFESWWQSQHRPAMVAVETAVTGLGQSARNNVSQQQTASQA
jgi:WXG100 family type VII secretion target